MRRFLHMLLPIALCAAVFAGCSTTRVLASGEYRLAKTKVKVVGNKKFKTSQLDPCLKQRAEDWSALLWVYNWADRDDNTGWGRFVHKLGVAPVVYDPDLLNASVDNLVNHLEYLGYYNSKVRPFIDVKRRKVKVRYDVELGKQYPIKSISYEVPERGSVAEDFYADTASVTVHPGNPLSEASLEAESERSSAHLRKLGYYGLNKNYYSFEADTMAYPDSAVLKMRIREYTRNETPAASRVLRPYTFGTVDLYYPESLHLKEKLLRNLTTIRPGDPYSEAAVSNTYSRLSALRVLSSVNVELDDADSSTVDCNIHLTQGRLQGLKFNLEGSTNSSGLFGIAPEINYYHKNIFHGGEQLNLGFRGNFQFKFNDPARSTEFGVSAGISFPRFLGLPYRYFKGAIPNTDIKASYNYQNRPEYTRNIISTSYSYSGRHKNLVYQVTPVRLSIVRLFDLNEDFYSNLASNPFLRNAYENHFDLGMVSQFHYSTNSDINPKTSYRYASLQFALAGNTLSLFKPLMAKDEDGDGMIWNTPFAQYVRAELTLGRTWRFGREDEQAIAVRFLAGAGFAYGNSQALPFEQHFYSGGASSMRGWQVRGLGPGFSSPENYFVIPNQTGDMKLEANLEYRFHMFWKLDGAAFFDVGNIWTLNGDDPDDPGRLKASTFFESLGADWGLGLRLDLGFILVRVDYGLQLYNPSFPIGIRWLDPWTSFLVASSLHFGVGYPF